MAASIGLVAATTAHLDKLSGPENRPIGFNIRPICTQRAFACRG